MLFVEYYKDRILHFDIMFPCKDVFNITVFFTYIRLETAPFIHRQIYAFDVSRMTQQSTVL